MILPQITQYCDFLPKLLTGSLTGVELTGVELTGVESIEVEVTGVELSID